MFLKIVVSVQTFVTIVGFSYIVVLFDLGLYVYSF